MAYQAARHLVRRGHQVTVWSSDFGQEDVRFPDLCFEVKLFPCAFARWGFYPTPALVSWARDHVAEFDVIHLHNLRTFQNVVVAGAARRAGVPYILSAHGSLPHIVERKGAKWAFDLLFGRGILDGAQRLVAVSPSEVEQYRQSGVEPERMALILNGLDLDEFAQPPPPGLFRKRLGLPPDAKLIFFLGRIHRRKGLDHLVSAFTSVYAAIPEARLVIAGPDDGDLARLRGMADAQGLNGRVLFPGPLYDEDRLSAMVDADILASPAAHEVFGLVPFEALLCGTPVVVAGECGSGQLIDDAQAGCTVPYGDVEALIKALLSILSDPAIARQKVASGQALVRGTLNWAVAAGRLESLYNSVRTHSA